MVRGRLLLVTWALLTPCSAPDLAENLARDLAPPNFMLLLPVNRLVQRPGFRYQLNLEGYCDLGGYQPPHQGKQTPAPIISCICCSTAENEWGLRTLAIHHL